MWVKYGKRGMVNSEALAEMRVESNGNEWTIKADTIKGGAVVLFRGKDSEDCERVLDYAFKSINNQTTDFDFSAFEKK